MIANIIHWIIGINIVLVTALILKNISTLPSKIPLHFDSKGEADRIYTKHILWIFPVMNAVIAILPIDIFQSLIMHALMSTFFVYLTFLIIEDAKNKNHKMSRVIICTIFIVMCIITGVSGILEIHSFTGK